MTLSCSLSLRHAKVVTKFSKLKPHHSNLYLIGENPGFTFTGLTWVIPTHELSTMSKEMEYDYWLVQVTCLTLRSKDGHVQPSAIDWLRVVEGGFPEGGWTRDAGKESTLPTDAHSTTACVSPAGWDCLTSSSSTSPIPTAGDYSSLSRKFKEP